MAQTVFSRSALLLAAAVLALSGCECRPGGVHGSSGELGVIWLDADGNRFINRDAYFDFGHAMVGQKVPMTLTVRNTGSNGITLSSLDLASGDPVTVGANVVGQAAFEVHFDVTNIAPSEQANFDMFFTPQVVKGAFESKLTLSAEGTRAEDSTASITLRGAGEAGACDLPGTIDFGKVPVGQTLPWPIEMRNPSTVDAEAFAGDLAGTDAASFGYASYSQHGTFMVPAKTTTVVDLNFSPTEKRVYTAQVDLHGPGACPTQTVQIRGEGSDDVLSWAPTSLNFGYVSPPYEGIRDVIFTNLSNTPIRITNLASTMPTDFFQSVPAGQDQSLFVVPGNASTPMHVSCAPSGLGPRNARLNFNTPLTNMSSGVIQLDCIGGGPKIKVTPNPTVAFGRVGFFPGNSTFSVQRKVTVQNVGTHPVPADPTLNLYLGQVDASGVPGNLPLWDLIPAAGTDPSEISVNLGSAYDPTVGLEAVAGRNFVDLTVTVKPLSVGLKQAELVIYSNDSQDPAIHLTLTADAQQLPPCNFQVSPAQGNFGLVSPGTTKDLPITITNLGTQPTDICYLSGIDLAPGTSPAYSIVGGPVVDKELQPQQSWDVVVRVEPPGPVPTSMVTLLGQFEFNVTSPTTPQVVVPLLTNVGPTCLAITPDPLDFGTVKIGCNSTTRTITVYNVCSTTVALTSFSVQAAAGQPPGGPNCPGSTACPEFYLYSPSIPVGGIQLAPAGALTFQAKYAPIDSGGDSGAISIGVVQSGQTITYLVGLQGRGDSLGTQTDTYVQDLQPKADILLVVDDSCSMNDKQANLAANFGSFIQYAVSANVDYQIGITTTTTSDQDCVPGFGCVAVTSYAWGGKLRRDAANLYIMKPNTPNVAAKFAQMVNMGSSGSGTEMGLEAAVMALTPPVIASDNLGFLRPDANLAIVVVSDAGDQSPNPLSYYQNRLVNVKGFSRLSMFTFNNIGPYGVAAPIGCTYDDFTDASRYAALVQYTSGVRDEICTTSWATTLQQLGRTVFGFRTQFFLGNVPDFSNGQTVTITINGNTVAVSPTCSGSTTPACYDSTTNAIIFTPTSTPGPGQTMSVTYTVACF